MNNTLILFYLFYSLKASIIAGLCFISKTMCVWLNGGHTKVYLFNNYCPLCIKYKFDVVE